MATNPHRMLEIQAVRCLNNAGPIDTYDVKPVVPAAVVPAAVVPVAVAVVPVAVAVVPAAAAPTLQTKSKFTSPESKHPIDPLLLAIETTDPMYEIANRPAKLETELKEAQRLEGLIAKLYATENGRSRGWTKTHLEEFMKPRVAGGASTRNPFDWSAVFTDKKASAALDFLTLAKGIRLAVWNAAEKVVGIWPAADIADASAPPPLYHVTATGIPLHTKTSPFETGWSLRAPLAVEHGLEKLSLDELTNIAESLGITKELVGKKQERVRTLATARMERRFRPTEITPNA